MDQKSGHRRWVCIRGVTMAGVHLYGKGRASVGLISTIWITGTEPAHLAIARHRLQLRYVTPYGAPLVSPALR